VQLYFLRRCLPMILLEHANKIIVETLKSRKESGRTDALDVTIADFDGVTFHISSPGNESKEITISVATKCLNDLKANGLDAAMNAQYKKFLTTTESTFDVSLKIPDVSAIDEADITLVSLIKRNILAVPLQKGLGSAAGKIIELHYRGDEAIYIKPDGAEQATLVYSIQFKDPGDVIFAQVFLQEFADVRRKMTNVPALTYTKEPPGELKGIRGLKEGADVGYVTMVVFKNHLAERQKEKTIDLILTFRDYLHYHIKCSKAYLHTRMRKRVADLLKILNRAKPEKDEKDVIKRTFQGKAFNRK